MSVGEYEEDKLTSLREEGIETVGSKPVIPGQFLTESIIYNG